MDVPEESAIDLFNRTLAECTVEHGHLLALEEAGFREEMPSERFWHFTHPKYPGVWIRWSPIFSKGQLSRTE